MALNFEAYLQFLLVLYFTSLIKFGISIKNVLRSFSHSQDLLQEDKKKKKKLISEFLFINLHAVYIMYNKSFKHTN